MVGDGSEHFRRVQIQEPGRPIRNVSEAFHRLAEDMTDATALAFIGAEMLSRGEADLKNGDEGSAAAVNFLEAVQWLRAALELGNGLADPKRRVADIMNGRTWCCRALVS
jgi:hypothetical protein